MGETSQQKGRASRLWAGMQLRWKIAGVVTSIIGFIILVWNFASDFNTTYAKTTMVKEVVLNIEKEIAQDRDSFKQYQMQQTEINRSILNRLEIQHKQQRIWDLERYYRETGEEMPFHVLREIEHLKSEIRALK